MDRKIIEKYLKPSIDSVLGKMSNEFKQVVSNRLIEYQAEEYYRNLYSKTLLHRTNPKKLADFYQPLSIQNIETDLDSEKKETESVKKIFEENKNITIIGNAGSGKSTLIKYLFIACIKEQFKIPIKIELRYLNDYNGNLIDYIKNNIFAFQKLAINDKIAERLLDSGKFLFFLDGYDELNKAIKEETTKEIDNLTSRFNKNNYLLTTRPHTGIELLPCFHNYRICDLIDKEINSFVEKQIPSTEKELKEKIIEAIQKPENSQYDSFLRNPLLLSMFILTFQSYANIPQKKSVFYRQVFDTLFSLHDSISKLAYVREKESGLSKEGFEDVLKLFCFISFFGEKFIFSSDYINKNLNIIKAKKKSITFNNQLLINDLTISIGILNKEGLDYTFPHRSLQEYFAAQYIVSQNNENKKKIYKKMLDKICDYFISPITQANFYLLLTELDYEGVITEIILPYLDYTKHQTQTIKKLNTSTYMYNELAFNTVGQFQSVVTAFNIKQSFPTFFKAWNLFFTAFRKHLLTQKKTTTEVKKNTPNNSNTMQLTIQATIKELKGCIVQLEANIPKIVRFYKEELALNKKSDEDIIDLIL